jgi:hypothetical protein
MKTDRLVRETFPQTNVLLQESFSNRRAFVLFCYNGNRNFAKLPKLRISEPTPSKD